MSGSSRPKSEEKQTLIQASHSAESGQAEGKDSKAEEQVSQLEETLEQKAITGFLKSWDAKETPLEKLIHDFIYGRERGERDWGIRERAYYQLRQRLLYPTQDEITFLRALVSEFLGKKDTLEAGQWLFLAYLRLHEIIKIGDYKTFTEGAVFQAENSPDDPFLNWVIAMIYYDFADYEKISPWIAKAREASEKVPNSAIYCLLLANEYYFQTPANLKEARVWYQKAYDLGMPQAAYYASLTYAHPAYPEQSNPEQRNRCLCDAATKGHALALQDFSWYCREARDFRESLKMEHALVKVFIETPRDPACAIGVSALRQLGEMYEHGAGVTPNKAQMSGYYQKWLEFHEIIYQDAALYNTLRKVEKYLDAESIAGLAIDYSNLSEFIKDDVSRLHEEVQEFYLRNSNNDEVVFALGRVYSDDIPILAEAFNVLAKEKPEVFDAFVVKVINHVKTQRNYIISLSEDWPLIELIIPYLNEENEIALFKRFQAKEQADNEAAMEVVKYLGRDRTDIVRQYLRAFFTEVPKSIPADENAERKGEIKGSAVDVAGDQKDEKSQSQIADAPKDEDVGKLKPKG